MNILIVWIRLSIHYYSIGGKKCPALFFDPLIVVGGDRTKDSSIESNYASRCDKHYYLPGNEYTFFTFMPLGEAASRDDTAPLIKEIEALKSNKNKSILYSNLMRSYGDDVDGEKYLNSLLPDYTAEKAFSFLFCEQKFISEHF